MKRYTVGILALLILLVAISAGCGGAATPTPAAAPTVAGPTSSATLDIVGLSAKKTLTISDMKALPAVEGWGGIKNSAGKVTPPVKYKGVSLQTLAQQVGGLTTDQGLQLVGSDGYAMTMSSDQALNANFVTYDPGTGDEVKNAGKLTAIIAYEADGKPLPTDSDGAFRLAVISEKNNQVVDGHWTVKWLARLEIKSMAAEWTLPLTGKIADIVDRGTFESCSTPNCHGKTWTDDKAQKWTGTPLWLIAGRIDDETKHGDGAFNNDVAAKGYNIKVIAKDGLTATFPISRIKRDDTIIVANSVNGNPLDDKNFPLRLVGPGLTGKESVGGIAQIVLDFNPPAAATTVAAANTPVPATATVAAPTATKAPAAATATPCAACTVGSAALSISGAVAKPLSWPLADLKNVGTVKLDLTHPKKGKLPYEGVRLSVLLGLVQPTADAKTLTLTASDGYKTDVALADALKCTDCMVAIDASGALSSAMPDMASSAWVGNLIKIEVK